MRGYREKDVSQTEYGNGRESGSDTLEIYSEFSMRNRGKSFKLNQNPIHLSVQPWICFPFPLLFRLAPENSKENNLDI